MDQYIRILRILFLFLSFFSRLGNLCLVEAGQVNITVDDTDLSIAYH